MYQLFAMVISFFSVFINAEYTSQVGQDSYIYKHFFKESSPGFFCDIGAFDGITFSNTYFFEKDLKWKGICFEPLPHLFEQLQKNRNCICVNACVAAREEDVTFIHVDGCDEMLSGIAATFDKRHLEMVLRDTHEYGGSCKIMRLPAVRLDTILAQYHILEIDYLSIDTEGNEFEILQSIDFAKIAIKVISVENNYEDQNIRNYLIEKGYLFVTRLHVDDIFYNPDLITFLL